MSDWKVGAANIGMSHCVYSGEKVVVECVADRDAALIVRCVNSHDDLVKALEVCVEQLDYMSDMTDDDDTGRANIDAVHAGRAALSKAKGDA
jgi:hypothetical protein